MAGDWIKMRTSLVTSPKVNGIARILEQSAEVGKMFTLERNSTLSDVVTRNVTRNVTVSLLLTLWSAANEHTRNGIFKNADLSDIDDIVGVPGFGNALSTVGWAIHDAENDCVTLPNFNEYNTSGDERLASAAERQRRYREKKKAESNASGDVTRDVTGDGEKRREEKRSKRREREKAGVEDMAPDENIHASGAQESGISDLPPIGKFPITNDWTPLPDFARRATLWGKNIGDEPGYSPEELQQFRDYWVCDGRVKHHQQWEMAFADSLLQSRGRVQRSSPSASRSTGFAVSKPDNTIPPGFRG